MGEIMRRPERCYAILLLATSLAAAAEATAQSATERPFDRASDRLQAEEPQVVAVGIEVAPGIIVTPSVFKEAGYDSNPDKQFDEEGSSFITTGVGLGVSAIGERTLVNLNATGEWRYFIDEVDRDSRLKGAVEGRVIHMLAPGLALQAGGLFENDEFSFTEDQLAGAFAELGYQDSAVAAFLRSRFTDIRYLESDFVPPEAPEEITPLLRTSSFDAQRAEIGGGVLIGNRHWWGFYGEANLADVNYTNQELEDEIDRDADDAYAKAGIRIVFSPVLHGDFGMRWNRRTLEDDVIDDFNSSYFDGALTWRPSRYFALTATIERVIGEPSATWSRLSDIKSYEIKGTYQPLDGLSLAFRAVRQNITEIGDNFQYDSTELDARITYDYSARTQVYSEVRYEFFDQNPQDADYERFRALAGVRVIVDGEDPISQGDFDRLAYIEDARRPRLADLSLSAGYSSFDLPEIRMGTVVSGGFFDEARSRLNEHDGDLDGVRFDARLSNAAIHPLGDGTYMNFGFSGFYANYDGSGRDSCSFTDEIDCAYVNILDFDPNEENNTGPFGELIAKADRTLHYWGVSVDTGMAWGGGGLKDGVPERAVSPWKIGLGVRGLNERTDVKVSDPLSPHPVDYDQKLDTHYYGGFIGFADRYALLDGWLLSLDVQGGVYRAHTDYEGRYAGYVLSGDGFIREWGRIEDDKDDSALIAGVQVGIGKALDWGSVEVYGQAEYLSFVPKVEYNNNDAAGGSPFGIAGDTVGTKVTSDEGVNYTFGLKIEF
jgi:hypothetical protein